MALVVALGVAHAQPLPSALAAPAPPSWDDVEAAKGDVEATEVAVARIRESAEAMNAELEQLRIAALIAGEQYQSAMLALDEATTTMTIADRRRDAALERAEASGQQAAQLATQLARAGGGDLTMALMVSGDNADELLYRLGTMSALSSRTNDVLSRAVADRNVAAALSDQAIVARDAHAELVADAASSYTVAAVAAGDAEDRAAAQQELLDDLSAKLAELTDRSVALEREYLDSLETPPSGPGPSPSPSAPAPSPSVPSPSVPAPSPSAPAPSPSASSPAPTPSSPPPAALQPNATAVAAAIAFARAQVGEPYQFAAAGPDAWDCSGLTMMAYSAAGLSIGGHGSTAQYTRASSRGVLVPYSQVLPGDLIFYSSGGSTSASKYHVALYIGDGLMIEAPYPGKPVRIVPVRSFDRVGLVARPSA
jgi:cell wall-associated NlpC family hydrolase